MPARTQLKNADTGSPAPAAGAAMDAGSSMSFADGLAANSPAPASPLQLKDSGDKAPAAKGKTEAKDDLGEVDGLGKKFQKRAGSLAEKCAPENGRTGRMTVFVNVPVAAGGMVKVSFKFMGQVSRGDDGHVTMKLQVGGGVTAGKKIDLYFATVDAFAAAQVFGYVEAKGESGEECMRLIALGLHNRLSKASKRIANAVFGPETIQAALDEMDEDDYVETGLGLEAVVGGGGEIAPDIGAGGWMGGSKQKGERLSKGEGGELKSDKMDALSLSLGTWLPPFRLMGGLTLKRKNGVLDSGDGSVTGVAMMSIGDIEGRLLGGTFLLDALAGLAKDIGKARKGLKDKEALKVTDEMVDEVLTKSSGKFAIHGGSHLAIKALSESYTGLLIGMSLSLTLGWTKANGFKLTVKLEKQDRIDIGESFRDDLLNVRLENLQSIFETEL